MGRRMLVFLMSLILAIVIVMVAGCNVNPPLTKKSDLPKPRANRASYLIANSQTIQNEEIILDTKPGRTHCFISQIKDSHNNDNAQKLNASIRKDVESAIAQIQSERSEKLDYIGSNPDIVANNLLAISINSYYEVPDYGLLYNLKNGARLTLKDVFLEGTDYVSILNRLIPPAILAGRRSEEDLMRSPFTTVRADQPFALKIDQLYLVFAKGEAGFAERYSVGIPLSQLDPYMDIMDKYLTPDLASSNAVKYNNIYFEYEGQKLQSKPIMISGYGLTISGLHTPFEQTINTTLQNELNHLLAVESEKVKDYKPDPTVDFNPNLSVRMYPVFNHYGILTVVAYIGENVRPMNYEMHSKFLSFDLKHEKIIDPKDLLFDYFQRTPLSKDKFLAQIKSRVQKDFKSNPQFQKEFQQKFQLSLLKSHFHVNFTNYLLQNETYLTLTTEPNTFDYFASSFEIAIPLAELITGSFDAFFNF